MKYVVVGLSLEGNCDYGAMLIEKEGMSDELKTAILQKHKEGKTRFSIPVVVEAENDFANIEVLGETDDIDLVFAVAQYVGDYDARKGNDIWAIEIE